MVLSTSNGQYKTERRSSTRKRRNPILQDEASNTKESELPGKLCIETNSNKTKESTKSGLAGSEELLAYFHRLSGKETHGELIDVQYIVALLAAGADINVTDRYGQTALHAAARDWHPDVARFLIDNGADVNKQDIFGRSPIFIAAALDYAEMIEFLASKGANIHMRTFGEMQVPLHYAAKNEAVSSIRCLIKLGADTSAKDYKERVPLYIAVYHATFKSHTNTLGCDDAVEYLLDIGCPAAVYDSKGESAIAMMVEKMPSIAYKALHQFIITDEVAGRKTYFLSSLDSAQLKGNDERKTVLDLIVKYNEVDLLYHPLIRRLMELQWKQYGFRGAMLYLVINLVYVLLWTALVIIYGAKRDAFRPKYYWNLILAFIALTMNIIFMVEQIYAMRKTGYSERLWKKERIENIEEDKRFCHPQWPDERKSLEAQIDVYDRMVGDHYKNPWNYMDCISAIGIIILWCLQFARLYGNLFNLAMRVTIEINIIIIIVLTWLRFMKACKAFPIFGQFIVILGSIITAIGQFAVLFLIFFVPFTAAFWIFFGGDKNAATISQKVKPGLAEAFRKYNDVVYTVWTLTLVIGFPLKAIQAIEKYIANIYVSTYYFFMSVVCLNLFIALLSLTFSRLYNLAYKYALLEQAKSNQFIWMFLRRNSRRQLDKFLQNKCSPLIEKLGFRESKRKTDEPAGNRWESVKREGNNLITLLNEKADKSSHQQRFALKKIGHQLAAVERNQHDYEAALSSLHKLKVENMKILKLLGGFTSEEEKFR
eukprot:gene6340-7066_t